MNAPLLDRVRERLAADGAPLRPSAVAAAIRAESGGVLGDTEVLTSLRELQTELVGAGILEPLLCAPGTTDVLVTAPDAVWVDDGSGLRRTPISFADEAAVRRLAQRLALAAGRRLDDAQPWVDGQLSGLGLAAPGAPLSVRLHAVLPPVAAAGTCLSLRVLRPATQDLDVADRVGRHRRRRRRTAARHHRRPAGVPRLGRNRRGKDDPAGRPARRRCGRRADRVRRGRGRTGAAASACGQARRALRERRGGRRGHGPRPGPAGAAHATRPDRRRRGARRRGRRPAHRPEHRPRRRRRHRARQQPGRGARTLRGARRARRSGPGRRCTASSAPRSRSCCTSPRDRAGRRRLSEIGLLRRGDDGRVQVLPCWHVDAGTGPWAGDLRRLIEARCRP